jgi:very-short-patch-repair endonuclease
MPISSTRLQILVRDGIERLRLKLLDLSNSNRLLNFKFSDSSRRFVRIVDERPDLLFGRLTDESSSSKKLFFASLPEPTTQNRVGDVALLSDEFALMSVEGGTTRSVKMAPKINLVDWANKNGIDPSYDLPALLPRPSDAKHSDNQIQTLLLPDVMERKLAAIRDDANLAMQELGLSTLFAAFGYLEWYESESSDEPRFAPLVLLPLQIDRELKQHKYRYFVEAAEATEAISNISLAERLKRDFGYALPELTEDELPETYFQRVTKSIRPFPRWKVRRFICIGHFSFSRLVMYEDLSAKNWDGNPLEENELIASILAGSGRESSDGVAADYDVESLEVEQLVPALITDADSSQHSAIVDAMKGRSFALKGPPGTGKSQTITNLIAAALAAGKRVLFVAEKQAALDVVAERLAHAGLSPFLLELHSTKIQKRKVLASFDARLKLRKRREDGDLDATMKSLRQTRAQLGAYVSALNSPVGNSGLTLHNVYWMEQDVRRVLDVKIQELARGLENEAFAQMSAQTHATHCDLLVRLANAFAACQGSATISEHPLFGVTQPGFGADDQLALFSRFEKLDTTLEKLSKLCERRGSVLACQLAETLPTLRQFSSTAAALPGIPERFDFSLTSILRNVESTQALQVFCSDLERHISEREALGAIFKDLDEIISTSEHLATTSDSLVAKAASCGVTDVRVDEFASVIANKLGSAFASASLVDVLERFQSAAGLTTPLTTSHVLELAEAIELLRATPTEVLQARVRGLAEADAKELMVRCAIEATELRRDSDALAESAELPLDHEPSDLRAAARALSETGLLSIPFSSRYRSARKLYSRIGKGKWRGRESAAALLDRVAKLVDRRRAFDSQERIRYLAGKNWRGIDTPFGTLTAAAEYLEFVRRRWPALDPAKQPLQFVLSESDARLLSDVVDSVSQSQIAELRSIVDVLKQDVARLASESIATLTKRLVEITDLSREIRLERLGRPLGISKVASEYRRVKLFDALSRKLHASMFATAMRLPVSPSQGDLDLAIASLKYATSTFGTSLPLSVQMLLLSKKAAITRQAIQTLGAFINESVREVEDCLSNLVKEHGLALTQWLNSSTPLDSSVRVQLGRVKRALACSDNQASDWMLYRDVAAQSAQQGLGQFCRLLDGEQVAPSSILQTFRIAYLRSLVKHASSVNTNVPRWTGDTLEGMRKRLRQLDTEYTERAKQLVYSRLMALQIPTGVSQGPVAEKTERALIEHEIGKQRRHIPIRELLRRAAKAARAAKPCFMMSPASVAQFLPASNEVFDLAIVDEASQMRPEEALGVLARARQAIVVGDPMQLPPTTFFNAEHEEANELAEDELDVDTESVLDLALSSFRPPRELLWHYRSQHQSLIAFSNREFYDDSLVVFPSPNDKSVDMGVQLLHIEDGTYGASLNVPEASAVVDTVSKIIRSNPDRSIGVVSINQPQKEHLRQAFDKLFAEDDDLEKYRTKWSETLYPFFVKNLENVQGDERDIIVISTVYGPATKGAPVMQRFGPINSKMGHRRLNVLFTRAKQRVVVVTSLRPEDVIPQSGSSRGVIALKNYLSFARSGRLDRGIDTKGSYDSPFEKEVAEVLRQLGFSTTPQIGVAGFFIDLGVRHPINSDHFVLGIECDGASYHSAKSARDRDRLRQEILERLGWNLYRIWSTDWFRSRDREVKKLEQHLRQLI